MAKAAIPDEVQVLRFFEEGTIEKAEVLFNIVSEKMRERLREPNEEHDRPPQSGSPRKRNASGSQRAAGVESTEQSPPT
jgi:hypothetical protein